MRIAGLPQRINAQLALLPNVQAYYQALSERPEVDRAQPETDISKLIEGIDQPLRLIIEHIGRHNELPRSYEPRRLTNGHLAESYRKYTSFGWANLRFLLRIIKTEFMPDGEPHHIMYRRQVALLCRGCDEHKASGMFEFQSKDMSYTRQIEFGPEHIIDPETAEFRTVRKHGRHHRKKVFCKTCRTMSKDGFERRHEGPYASAREYIYNPEHIQEMQRAGTPLPMVLAVRVRNKESANTAEKMAYMLSGKAPSGAEHFRIMQENRDSLVRELGRDTIDMLVEEAVYDKFGIRLIASSEDGCYTLRDWFREHFKVVREIDYIRGPPGPKENGYQSIHMTAMGMPTDEFTLKDGIRIPVDVQIRTMEMDKQADSGTAAWGDYKKRRDMMNHQFLLAVTAFRHYLFGV
jgi:hypothetical protein